MSVSSAAAAYPRPSWRQVTTASRSPQPSPQAAPQGPPSTLSSSLPSVGVRPPASLTSSLAAASTMGSLGGAGVVVVVVAGAGRGWHRTPAASVRSQSCTPQPSNLCRGAGFR